MDGQPLSVPKGLTLKKIAIIGTGIAGMAAGYFLRDKFDITFYEKEHYPGGHTNTLTVDEDGKSVHVDSAFMVYNEVTYPNLVRLFKELEVETKPTSMSFSVQYGPTGLEYAGVSLDTLFAQRRNLFNIRYIKMLSELARFNRECVEVLDNPRYHVYTLAQYLKEKKLGDDMTYQYILPMSSAIWSTPLDGMLAFPVLTLVRFFKNHGFLGGLKGHYQWRTVVDGSQRYRDKVLSFFPKRVLLKRAIKKVFRENGQARLVDEVGQSQVYDKVILASHADESLSILGDASDLERTLLGEFKYHKNRTTLHTDTAVMPRSKRAWASWNYKIITSAGGELVPTTIYHMNRLQGVSQKKDYFISINDPGLIDPRKVIWEKVYEHPVYNLRAIQAQQKLPKLNQSGITYFCGSYFKYGFHEDALTSGLKAARAITGERIWE